MSYVELIEQRRATAWYGPLRSDALVFKLIANREYVRSHFRAPWYGIVIKREKRKGCEDLCTVRVLKDRRGNWVRKPWNRTISEHWLSPTKPWYDYDALYNTEIPVMVAARRRDEGEKVLYMRRLRKYLRGRYDRA